MRPGNFKPLPPEPSCWSLFSRPWKLLFKQNLGLGRCHCRTIQAQENWAWCVVEAFHAVLRVRREVPGMTWGAAQRQAAQNAEKYVLTGMEQDGALLDAA